MYIRRVSVAVVLTRFRKTFEVLLAGQAEFLVYTPRTRRFTPTLRPPIYKTPFSLLSKPTRR